MIQSGEILGELLLALPYAAIKAGTQELIKRAPELTRNATRYFVNKGINRLKKDFKWIKGSGIALKNNETKDIMNVIKSLENRGILLKRTTTKIAHEEGGFLNFLRPLMTADLPLIKTVLTPLGKRILIPIGLSTSMSATDAAIQEKIYLQQH